MFQMTNNDKKRTREKLARVLLIPCGVEGPR